VGAASLEVQKGRVQAGQAVGIRHAVIVPCTRAIENLAQDV
jgi:hypothetical protein